MNSKSADKTLNFILNTLLRTLAPWEAIKTFRQKRLKFLSKLKEKKCQKTKFRTECCDFTKKKSWVQILTRQMTGNGEWTKNLKTYSVNRVVSCFRCMKLANPTQFEWKWAKLAVLFSRQLLNGSQDFFLF